MCVCHYAEDGLKAERHSVLSVQGCWMSAVGREWAVKHFVCLKVRDVGLKSTFCWHKNLNILVK